MVLSLSLTQMGKHGGTHLSAKECRIPVMIVGMPGTGKTLAVNIATSVLRGSNSMPFFRDFCDVANSVFRYQCLGMPWIQMIQCQVFL
jgi:Cdc6-like AAA superfamily ATPase